LAKPLTISQLNKIGDRLRKDEANEDDLRLLDQYRLSFEPAYEHVSGELTRLGLNPGGRHPKTVPSIVAKLNREKTRLSKMQDIAGYRVEVNNRAEQDKVVDDIKSKFPGAEIQDRREKPSSGYRAVHVIVEVDGCPVEIQVRTALQHNWASATEKLSDVVDSKIKYGGGPKKIREDLTKLSNLIHSFEVIEAGIYLVHQLVELVPNDMLGRVTEKALEDQEVMSKLKLAEGLEKAIKEKGIVGVVAEKEADLNAIKDSINTALKDLSEVTTMQGQ
jgi:putative GTP pyrophosphokinase